MAEGNIQFDRTVLARLDALGRRLRLYLLADGVATMCMLLVAAVFVTLLIDHTFWLARDMRATQLATLLAALAFMAWRYVLRPANLRLARVDLAQLVEKRYPHLESRLVTAVEFAQSQRHNPRYSPAMVESVSRQAAESAAGLTFTDTLSHQRFRRAGTVIAGCVALVAAASLMSGSVMSLWFERNVLLRNVDWPQANRLIVQGLEDGRLMVPRGDDVTVTATVAEDYQPPRQAFIRWETAGGNQGREQMPATVSTPVRFEYTFERINDSRRCEIFGGDATPQTFAIEVVDRPRVQQVVLSIEPPAYTNLSPFDLRAGQTVAEALPGSVIRFHIETNKPVSQVALMRDGTDTAEPAGEIERKTSQSFVATEKPTGTGNYHFELIDTQGFANTGMRSGPVRFTVRLVADRPPNVKSRVHGAGEMITPEAILPVETDFSDMYGLTTAELVYELDDSESQPVVEPLEGFKAETKTFAAQLNWSVAARGLQEGQRLTLYARAADADNINGPNLGSSTPSVFRVVSREELLAELNRREQEYRQDFERVIGIQEELFGDLLTVQQGSDSEATGEQRTRELRQLARRQRDQAGRINTLRLQFEQVLSELRINQLADAAVEERIGGGIVVPLGQVNRELMPVATDDLNLAAAELTPEAIARARASQEELLSRLREIHSYMLQWERYQEAVMLLRDIIKLQRQVSQETEKSIAEDIFGTDPDAPASNP